MWESIKAFFAHSETIFLARLNALIGAVATAATYIDPTLVEPLLTPRNFAVYILVNAIATEYLRRRRADDL